MNFKVSIQLNSFSSDILLNRSKFKEMQNKESHMNRNHLNRKKYEQKDR